MGYVARITKNGAVLVALDGTGPYSLSNDFRPPVTVGQPDLTGGLASRPYDGEPAQTLTATNIEISFGVHITGSSAYQVRKGITDLTEALWGIDDPKYPTWFEYREDTGIAGEPLWGQLGVYRRYQIAGGGVEASDLYGMADLRNEALPDCRLTLILRPSPRGKAQRVALAIGGIIEDNIGKRNKKSRGIRVGNSMSNLHTNPAFMNATYDTNYAHGADIIHSKNTDMRFVLFGLYSSKLTAHGAATNYFYEHIVFPNANNYIRSIYVRRPDGAPVTTADCLAYDSVVAAVAATTAFTPVGDDGWYRMTASGIGTMAGADIGITIVNQHTLYTDGWQCEEAWTVSPLAYGDLMGVAWSGAVHASSSTRWGGQLELYWPSLIDLAMGTVHFTIRPDFIYTTQGDFTLLSDGTLLLDYRNATRDFRFTDGVTTITVATTFAASEVVHITARWGPAGIALLLNGVLVGGSSSANYHPLTPLSIVHVGCTSAATGQCSQALIIGLTSFDWSLTDAEILALVNQADPIADADERTDWIPWFYNVGGDWITDNCYDATHNNWGVFGGIPGHLPAITEINGTSSDIFNLHTIHLSMLDSDIYLNPLQMLWIECQGVATGATESAGQYTNTAGVTNATIYLGGSVAPDVTELQSRALEGRQIYSYFRLLDHGANLKTRLDIYWGLLTARYYSEFKLLTTDATFRLFRNEPQVLFQFQDIKTPFVNPLVIFNLQGQRTVAGAADVHLDYICLMPKPLLVIDLTWNISETFIYDSDHSIVIDYQAASLPSQRRISLPGDKIEFLPDKYNLVMNLLGDIGDVCPIATTLTYNAVYVTPRFNF